MTDTCLLARRFSPLIARRPVGDDREAVITSHNPFGPPTAGNVTLQAAQELLAKSLIFTKVMKVFPSLAPPALSGGIGGSGALG